MTISMPEELAVGSYVKDKENRTWHHETQTVWRLLDDGVHTHTHDALDWVDLLSVWGPLEQTTGPVSDGDVLFERKDNELWIKQYDADSKTWKIYAAYSDTPINIRLRAAGPIQTGESRFGALVDGTSIESAATETLFAKGTNGTMRVYQYVDSGHWQVYDVQCDKGPIDVYNVGTLDVVFGFSKLRDAFSTG